MKTTILNAYNILECESIRCKEVILLIINENVFNLINLKYWSAQKDFYNLIIIIFCRYSFKNKAPC